MNHQRVNRLIYQAIDKLNLDLSGYTVYTEVGTGLYAVTPVIATLAGAKKVYAISKDTSYGTAQQAFDEMDKILSNELSKSNIVKVTRKEQKHLYEADIVTNLGHVRPMDKNLISMLNSSKVVIPYMCEAWEIRPGDVDLIECFNKNIPVMGTNEEHFAVDCFKSCGTLAVKLILESGLEIRKNKIAIYSNDKFGEIIYSTLQALGAEVKLFEDATLLNVSDWSNGLDALVIADYRMQNEIIGMNGIIDLKRITEKSPDIIIIPFAGSFDLEYAESYDIEVYPKTNLEASRMSKTLAYLGPKPTIDLLAGGLKVGQIMKDVKKAGRPLEEIFAGSEKFSGWEGLSQVIPKEFYF